MLKNIGGQRLKAVSTYVITNEKGYLVVDGGWVKIWHYKPLAMEAAKYLASELGVPLRVRKSTPALWARHPKHVAFAGIHRQLKEREDAGREN